MNKDFLISIVLRALTFLVDSIVWWFGIKFLLTGFFGYTLKKNRYGKLIVTLALILNTLITTGVYVLIRLKGTDGAITNEILMLFILIYFMVYLNESGKIKRFFLIFFSMNIFITLFNLIDGFSGLLPVISMENKTLKYMAALGYVWAQQLLTLLFIAVLSKLSGKKRREPMEFSLVVTAFIFSVLVDTVMNFFNVSGYGQINPMVTVRMLFNEDMQDQAVTIIVLLFVMAVVIVFLFMLIRESESAYFHKKSTVSEYYLEAQKSHYENLVESNREIRKIRHDMKNHIYCMQELAGSGKYEELSEYLNTLSEGFSQAAGGVKVGNEIADAIISEKMNRAKDADIEICVDGTLFDLELKAIDICTIFANLLDNAIEAVEKIPKEYRKIELSIKKNKNYYLISESNMTDRKAELSDGRISTTKKDKKNHGFGIINIKDAVAKYDGECDISISEADETGYFVFQFDIMIPVEKADNLV